MIEESTQKLFVLREQKDKLDYEAHRYAEKRNKLNEQVRSLRTETLQLRDERDKLNEEVKEQRNEMTAKVHRKIEEIETLNQDRKALAEKRPSRSHQSLQKEVDEIDWKIQTASPTMQEERQLVEKVKQLETQLDIHRRLEQLAKKVLELRSEIKAVKKESEFLHRKLTDNAHKSQETHRKMLEKIEESKRLKAEADDMHKQFLATRERTKPLQEEMAKISSRIAQLKDEIQREEEEEKKESEDALREKLEKEAREKLKRKEKLSWEEFQLLAEKGLKEQGQSEPDRTEEDEEGRTGQT
jgi:uncharacterized coiled-coil DUF342 family protein